MVAAGAPQPMRTLLQDWSADSHALGHTHTHKMWFKGQLHYKGRKPISITKAAAKEQRNC